MQKEARKRIKFGCKRRIKLLDTSLLVTFFLVILASFSLAITSTNYNSNVTVITSGGTDTSSTDYELLTAIGQIIGSITSANYKPKLGYIYTINSAPVNVTIPDQTWLQDNSLTLNLNNYFSDLDGDSLTYTSSSTNPSEIKVSITDGWATLTPKIHWYGVGYIQFTALDGMDTTQSNNVTLTVTPIVKKRIPQVSYRGSTGPPLPSKREFMIQPGLLTLTNFPPDSALVSIEINVLSAVEDAKLIAHEIPEVNVPKINAYTFLEILEFGIYFDKAVITFKVDNNWLISQNIEEDSIGLMLFDNLWVPLTTERVFSSQGYTYFKAETSRFGVFGVTGRAKLFEPVKEIKEITATVTKEAKEEGKEITQLLTRIKEQRIIYVIASSIIIVGLIILILLIHKREERKLKRIRKLIALGKFEKAEKLYQKVPKQEDIDYYLAEYRIQKETREREFKEHLRAAEKKIRQAVENGYTKKQIIEAFLQKGWNKKTIKDLLRKVPSESSREKENYYSAYEQNSSKEGFKFSKILLILLILLVSGVIFFLFKGGIGTFGSDITGFAVFNPYSNETLINESTSINLQNNITSENITFNVILPENLTYINNTQIDNETYSFSIPGDITSNGTIVDVTFNITLPSNETYNVTLPDNYTLNYTLVGNYTGNKTINYTQFSNETSNETEASNETFVFGTLAASNMPKKINIQGKLTDSSGNVLTGSYTFVFSLYDAYTAGSPLWTENQSISVSRGIYDTALGNVNDLNLTFYDPYYLGISVAYDSEATPRINLSTNPYSFRSNVTDYVDCSNIYGGSDSDFCADVGSAPDNYINVSGDTMTGNLTLQKDIIPSSDGSGNLGRSILRWLKGWFIDLRVDGKITSDDTVYIDANLNVSGNVTISGNLTLDQMMPKTQDIIIELNGGSLIIRP